jgi:hypothetical protein
MQSELTTRAGSVPSGRLWFGLAGSAFAWVALGVGDVLITILACFYNEQFGNGEIHSSAAVLYFILTALLIAIAVLAGLVSYREWRKLSRENRLLEAEGRGRREFMALLGIFVSFTLGIGLLWLTIPLLMLNLCVRAR